MPVSKSNLVPGSSLPRVSSPAGVNSRPFIHRLDAFAGVASRRYNPEFVPVSVTCERMVREENIR